MAEVIGILYKNFICCTQKRDTTIIFSFQFISFLRRGGGQYTHLSIVRYFFISIYFILWHESVLLPNLFYLSVLGNCIT